MSLYHDDMRTCTVNRKTKCYYSKICDITLPIPSIKQLYATNSAKLALVRFVTVSPPPIVPQPLSQTVSWSVYEPIRLRYIITNGGDFHFR